MALAWQPVVQVALHSAGAASRLASLLLAQIQAGILTRRASRSGRIAALGATRHLHHGLLDLFLSRAVPVRLGDVTVPVISPEDLIVTKVLAGRPKDLDDVHGVLCERLTSLDVDIVRETLAIVEQALGQSDLQPTFEALLARVRG